MSKNVKTNYHAHTYYCGHSTNDPETLIKSAIKNGYTKFGISEHMPLPHQPSRKPNAREFEQLIFDINHLKEKYKNEIQIFFGLECEYYNDETETLVKGYFEREDIDYLIFGNHFAKSCYYQWFEWNTVKDKKKMISDYLSIADYALASNLFSAFNHPDLIVRQFDEWCDELDGFAKDIVDMSIKYDTPIEFNLNGLAAKYDIDAIKKAYDIKELSDWDKIKDLKITNDLQTKFLTTERRKLGYPHYQFWQHAAGTKVKINIGVDTHSDKLMNDHYYYLALHLINEWGLSNNLVDDLEFKK